MNGGHLQWLLIYRNMEKELLQSKLTEYTNKYNQVIKSLQEHEILAQKLQGAIEAIDNLLKELDTENKE
jgi:hypothetical protein